MAGVENPYQPPSLEAESATPPPIPTGLQPLGSLARFSLRLYVAGTAYSLLDHIYQTVVTARRGLSLHDSVAEEGPDILGSVFGLAEFAAAILFLVWKYRAAVNARLLDPSAMKISPGLAVGSYFIPLVNLVLPYLAMAGIARASRVERFWAILWWVGHGGIFLIIIILFALAFRVELATAGAEEAPWPPSLDHFLMVWSVLTCFFTWQLIMRVTRAQMSGGSAVASL